METLIAELHFAPIVSSIVYGFIGMLMFLIGFFILEKITPYSIHKEIGEDHNVALGVIIGSAMIALAIIISAAIS